jgi:hypothetical protein
MRTNTYRLAVALQAKAIDSIDLHAGGVYTAAHSFGENITRRRALPHRCRPAHPADVGT